MVIKVAPGLFKSTNACGLLTSQRGTTGLRKPYTDQWLDSCLCHNSSMTLREPGDYTGCQHFTCHIWVERRILRALVAVHIINTKNRRELNRNFTMTVKKYHMIYYATQHNKTLQNIKPTPFISCLRVSVVMFTSCCWNNKTFPANESHPAILDCHNLMLLTSEKNLITLTPMVLTQE